MSKKIYISNNNINLYETENIKLKNNFNTNTISRQIIKTWNITRRAIINNFGKIIVFLILFSIVIILITVFEIPIDGSYIENSNQGQRFLSFLNIIILSIIVAGLVSIFNIENTITKDNNNNKDELLCKYKGIMQMLQYNYLQENITDNSEIKEIIIENDIDYFKIINSELKEQNKIVKNEELNDKIKRIKNIMLEKIVLQYIYDNINKDRYAIQLYNKIDELFIKLEIDDFSNIHSIKDDIISNVNKLLNIINNLQKNIEINIYKNNLYQHFSTYYYYLNLNIENKNLKIKNLKTFIINNKLPLNKDDFKLLIDNIDLTFINNLYLKLNDTCKNELSCNIK
jgi:hypothetical protein